MYLRAKYGKSLLGCSNSFFLIRGQETKLWKKFFSWFDVKRQSYEKSFFARLGTKRQSYEKSFFLDPRPKDKIMKKVFFLIWCQKTKLWKKFFSWSDVKRQSYEKSFGLVLVRATDYIHLKHWLARDGYVCAYSCLREFEEFARDVWCLREFEEFARDVWCLRVTMFAWVRRVCA